VEEQCPGVVQRSSVVSVLLWCCPLRCLEPAAHPATGCLTQQLEPCSLYSSAVALARAGSWKKILGGIMILSCGGGGTIF